MLGSVEREDDIFFDSVNYLSSERESEFDMWLNEPLSVAERRQTFLSNMGFSESSSRSDDIIELERITEFSGAVSSSFASCTSGEEESLVDCGREMDSQANSMVNETESEELVRPNRSCEVEDSTSSFSQEESEQCEVSGRRSVDVGKKKAKRWWNQLAKMTKQRRVMNVSETVKADSELPLTNMMKVKQNKKRSVEFTGVYMGQGFQGHKGYIGTMKFSPDGQFLATGGEDRIVRIWHVTSVNASSKSFTSEVDVSKNLTERKSSSVTRKKTPVSVAIPQKVFQIEESPLQEFHGHTGDILDLAWSDSNYLLSSSMDKTVRLWKLGCDYSLNVYRHSNYVTCIQFNPVDEQYFISGSIDGKVRIWGVNEKRVVYWADVRDVITAACYQPDGRVIVVGTVTGTCRFYEVSGNDLQLVAELQIQGRKKNYSNGITGIQFSDDGSQRVMITSEDSKVRIFDGVDIVQKFKGLPKSGSQMSASFASTGRHIISVGEDSRVYVWNYDGTDTPSSKHIKSVQSCEHFLSEGVSVAVPWSLLPRYTEVSSKHNLQSQVQTEQGVSGRRGSERFSLLGGWFFMDGPCSGGSQTWPEEKLPPMDEEAVSSENETYNQNPHHQVVLEQQQLSQMKDSTAVSDAWGLVIVTAGWDGKIRTYHNYGLPSRLH